MCHYISQHGNAIYGACNVHSVITGEDLVPVVIKLDYLRRFVIGCKYIYSTKMTFFWRKDIHKHLMTNILSIGA